MKKTRIVSLCISALLSVGLISSAATSGMYAKYSSTSYGTLNVEFNTTGKFVADTLGAKFSEILNDTSAGGKFETMIGQMNSGSDRSRWGNGDTYMGNVAGSGSDSNDTKIIEKLFDLGEDGRLEDANGTPVTIMIKRENLDNNASTGETAGVDENIGGAEITLYTTAVDLTKTSNGQKIEVFAMIFSKVDTTNSGDGEWHMIAQYQGTATTNDYTGSNGSNSINTDRWRAIDGMYYPTQDDETAGSNALYSEERSWTNWNPVELDATYMLANEWKAKQNLANIKAGLPVIE